VNEARHTRVLEEVTSGFFSGVLILTGLTLVGELFKPAPPGVTLTSISVEPATLHLLFYETYQLAAIGHYSDGSTADLTHDVTWSTSSDFVAAVGSGGLVTARSVPGACEIRAALSESLYGTASIIVEAEHLPTGAQKVVHFNDEDAARVGYDVLNNQIKVLANNRVGQTFTPAHTFLATGAWAKVSEANSWPDRLYLWIYPTTPEGMPVDPPVLTQGYRTDGLISAPSGPSLWTKFPFDSPVILEAGRRYALVFQYSQQTFGLERLMSARTTVKYVGEPYPGEYFWMGGPYQWVEILAGHVLGFEVWGTYL
jgi:hypothetical protein